jgi:isoleucyl-tRNA synthetase
MRGYHVIRRGGWDTHGLPVEISVERQLGFTNKSQIEAYGIARFNELCRQSAFAYIQEWEKFTDRLGFWVDLEDAYITYTNEYIESVWWILKTFWDKNLLYQGYKVVPYCPRCGTPLSDHEVALGYAEATDYPVDAAGQRRCGSPPRRGVCHRRACPSRWQQGTPDHGAPAGGEGLRRRSVHHRGYL